MVHPPFERKGICETLKVSQLGGKLLYFGIALIGLGLVFNVTNRQTDHDDHSIIL